MKFHSDSRRGCDRQCLRLTQRRVCVDVLERPQYALDIQRNRRPPASQFCCACAIHFPLRPAANLHFYTPKNAQGQNPRSHQYPWRESEGQSLPTFNSVIQFWVNEMGMAVLVPNVRGSSGYGKTYVRLDNGFNAKTR